ncbi:hypothetical protein [Salinisphaera hydrothermalis]|uniref:Uncharacterized protein n=1 Tax=Salinisphaera hydrothermalis (strain C41B8) TaxID=1304275 RepID=A0A084II34_SALHC|nr:hypothetical protein [Salinisphaera hydrothermalis]KEZ76368.1 hypothetical protein C41B8_15180 [Salinisphaera hydrothermalis C41B8]
MLAAAIGRQAFEKSKTENTIFHFEGVEHTAACPLFYAGPMIDRIDWASSPVYKDDIRRATCIECCG